jgi:hypothetical protein
VVVGRRCRWRWRNYLVGHLHPFRAGSYIGPTER